MKTRKPKQRRPHTVTLEVLEVVDGRASVRIKGDRRVIWLEASDTLTVSLASAWRESAEALTDSG
jgi:hypothetical protein